MVWSHASLLEFWYSHHHVIFSLWHCPSGIGRQTPVWLWNWLELMNHFQPLLAMVSEKHWLGHLPMDKRIFIELPVSREVSAFHRTKKKKVNKFECIGLGERNFVSINSPPRWKTEISEYLTSPAVWDAAKESLSPEAPVVFKQEFYDSAEGCDWERDREGYRRVLKGHRTCWLHSRFQQKACPNAAGKASPEDPPNWPVGTPQYPNCQTSPTLQLAPNVYPWG